MSLFFLHPIYLYGLIAASLPLLIHLLNRRRLQRIRFPAVRFVLLSQRRISRSYRLRHWLLLALRTLAVIFLVLLMANPIFQTGVGLFAGGAPSSLVIIVDNSLSMTWSRTGAGLDKAKEAARRLVSSLKDSDRAAVITTDKRGKTKTRLQGQREILLRQLKQIGISGGTADFSSALRKAYELLKEPAAQKEIWLITDMALTGWDRFNISELGQYDSSVPLKIISVGTTAEPLNATIKEIRMRGQGIAVGLPIHLEALVVNFTDKEIEDLLVQLTMDQQPKEQKLVTLPPKGGMWVSFQFNVSEAGDRDGSVTLKKEGLAGNLVSYFTLHSREKVKVLVVDGDPRTSLVQSETFFLTRALNPSGQEDLSLFLPTVVIPEGLSSVSLDSYDAIILCNVSALSDTFLPRLRTYLGQGKGLLFFAGDRIRPDDYNLKLLDTSPPILPTRLGDKRILSESAGEKIGKIDVTHPALRGFADPLLKDSLQSAHFRGYVHVDLPGRTALMTLTNGDPVLLERKMGTGRAVFFMTAADRDWSDLPLKTAFLPLVQSLVDYISAGGSGTMDTGIQVGESKDFSFPPAYVGRSLRIAKPDRKEREIIFVPDGERASVSFLENDLAGIYRLSLPASVEAPVNAARLYPVNSPFLESRLDPIGEKEIRAKLKPIRTEIIPIESLEKGGKRMDLSLPLLVLLIVTLAVEGWMGQRLYA
jgi:hypothetical protein